MNSSRIVVLYLNPSLHSGAHLRGNHGSDLAANSRTGLLWWEWLGLTQPVNSVQRGKTLMVGHVGYTSNDCANICSK